MNTGSIIITLIVVLGLLVALATDRLDPLKVFVIAVAVLVGFGVLPIQDAMMGFSNTGVLTVAVLFILTGSLQRSALFHRLTRFEHLKPHRFKPWLLFGSVSGLSAFLNNTPLVAMMMPIASRIAERTKISASTLLMPISFLAMLGGTLTLVGTSTNLIVSGLLEKQGYAPIGFFELTPMALPITLAGIVFMGLTYHTLPTRPSQALSDAKTPAHWVRFIVNEPSSIIGKTVEAAHLRSLRGVYLFGIERHGQLISPITPQHLIQASDCLIFTGQTDDLEELRRIDHLVLETDAVLNSDYFTQKNTLMVEAVVTGPLGSPGDTIKSMRFRDRYHAAVIGIVRHGRQLNVKPGSVAPVPGDVLLLITHRESLKALQTEESLIILNQSSRPAVKASMINDALPCLAYLLAIVVSVLFNINLLVTSLIAVALLLASETISITQALQWLDTKLILMIALSFAVGEALFQSGAAAALADLLIPYIAQWPVEGLLVLSFVIPLIITNLVTNNAAAILALPIVTAIITQTPYDPRPFLLLSTISASCAFLSPYGYQTNTMVAAVAPYRFMDFVRYGFPLTVITLGVAVISARLLFF